MLDPPVDALIFDLDDTLFDCTGQLTGPARDRAARCLAPAIPELGPEALCALQDALCETHGSGGAIREIGRRYALSPQCVERALEAYNRAEVEAVVPFPDVPGTLAELRRRGYRLCLVTSGRPERQRQKVERLGLTEYFNEAEGTLIFHDDRRGPDKGEAFRNAAAVLGGRVSRMLAVGDKLDAEIAAGNRLGMRTARLPHGRQKDRLPRTPEERPTWEIARISDLLDLLPETP